MAVMGLLAILLLNGENMRSLSARTSARSTRKTHYKERVKAEMEQAENAQGLSKVALERYKANCIMVVDSKTQKESYFSPGNAVMDTALNRPVRENALICNRLGDTAVVVNGTIERIASVSTEDWQTFTAILEARGYRPYVPKITPPKATDEKLLNAHWQNHRHAIHRLADAA